VRKATAAGITVVVSAGNFGKSAGGRAVHGGIGAPGNDPTVITVGAAHFHDTLDRSDDTVNEFSSRGPTRSSRVDAGGVRRYDNLLKPDLVAPGNRIVGAAATQSIAMAPTWNRIATDNWSLAVAAGVVQRYRETLMMLSGTSVAAPSVSGTVALMLQANPDLTPNEVKAILQYTAQQYAGYDRLTQGGGFLNAKGAVELARFLADPSGVPYPATDGWSGQLIWGNRLVVGGQLADTANAWPTDVVWGASTTPSGNRITWGPGFTKTVNVVWGDRCGVNDCHDTWDLADSGGAVSADDGDTVVWGTDDGDTVVWGTSCIDPRCEPIVWNRP